MKHYTLMVVSLFIIMSIVLAGCQQPAVTPTEEPPVPAGVMSSIEGFSEASTTYDTESMRSYLTDDFTWQSTGPVKTLDEYLAYVDANWERAQLRFEATGEPVIHLEGDTYVVEKPGLVTAVNLELAGTTVYRIVEVDDIWLINEIHWVDDPTYESTD